MNMSEEKDKIFAALSKFQGDLINAGKSVTGHGYNYADLAGCINAAKEPLAKNGLAVTQLISGEGEKRTLVTMLTHSSGQYISSEFTMAMAVMQGGAAKNPAQQMGGSITYMRRYAFAAIVGMAQEDNDAVIEKVAARTPINPDIEQAIQNNNSQWVKDNWTGAIANDWARLSNQQIDQLNILINQ